jgi:hypothetical protein
MLELTNMTCFILDDKISKDSLSDSLNVKRYSDDDMRRIIMALVQMGKQTKRKCWVQ